MLNLGVLAHVDAGKTSLTERLLYAAGVIDEIGSVDDGSTQTDSMDLERRRGITIKSAVVSFRVNDVTINLIDTLGHPDFIAEVERILDVLDGAVLVVSAVEGVQAQTRVLMRTLRRLGIPTILFVNKIDRRGARHEEVLASIAEKLALTVASMSAVTDLGSRQATSAALGPSDPGFTTKLLEVLADRNDAFLAAYVEGASPPSYARIRAELATQTRRSAVHPVFFGSAMTGAGVDALVDGITELLPAVDRDGDLPMSGSVFKVERGPAGEKIAYVRMFTGTIRVRDRLPIANGREGKVTAIEVFSAGSAVRCPSVSAGQIGRLWGLSDIRVGDPVGAPRHGTGQHQFFAPPTLEAVVAPHCPTDAGRLYAALSQLAEQDPLIDVRQDELGQSIAVSLYGEVQKEVVQATLADEYGIDVTFSATTTICVERPIGTGAAVEIVKQDDNPFLATVGLRVAPAAPGTGVDFVLEVELGSLPLSFMRAIEESTRATLRQGIHGWEVTDCTVALTHSGYLSLSSTAGDFRNLTPLVLMDALRAAGTRVHEPMHRFRLDVPADTLGAMLPTVARLGAVPFPPAVSGAYSVVEGHIPAARVHALAQRLPELSHGEGVLESTFSHYQPVVGVAPARPRTDHNPLRRKEYLLHVLRRV